ncbi:MAG TPA: hypothetical protein PLD20_15425 [Blastocatellia bacterium]|nr:hypothetical protein [Blastocatellia bacterium]HMV86311.1 hypothetical protein [Blastocatellia bacterium]HMX29414.1 hypothetical protein [Blastocatellia bacterium]HMY73289.1 hypothetical protein [Blastocatellia bacterium]HMZ19326.1 hypothetical protein [Blastocatellia bacterium]
MNKLIFLIAFLLLPAAALAQSHGTGSAEEMKKPAFLIGDWHGEGWIEMGPGKRSTFKQTETVQSKLNGTVLIVEGLGKGKIGNTGEEGVIHNALAVISYDAAAKKYQFRAFRADGNYIDAAATVGDKQLVWGFRDPQRGTEIKYTIKLTDAGQWREVGEFSMDGKQWRQFFEMTLQRAK